MGYQLVVTDLSSHSVLPDPSPVHPMGFGSGTVPTRRTDLAHQPHGLVNNNHGTRLSSPSPFLSEVVLCGSAMTASESSAIAADSISRGVTPHILTRLRPEATRPTMHDTLTYCNALEGGVAQ